MNALRLLWNLTLMDTKDMISHFRIILIGVDIPYHKNTVKSRQDSGVELNLIGNLFKIVISAMNRVSCCEN